MHRLDDTAENKLVLKGILPIGIKDSSLENKEYVGEPAGWLISKLQDTVTNSGESRHEIVGYKLFMYKNIVRKNNASGINLVNNSLDSCISASQSLSRRLGLRLALLDGSST